MLSIQYVHLKLVDERHKAARYRFNISLSIYGLSLGSIVSASPNYSDMTASSIGNYMYVPCLTWRSRTRTFRGIAAMSVTHNFPSETLQHLSLLYARSLQTCRVQP